MALIVAALAVVLGSPAEHVEMLPPVQPEGTLRRGRYVFK
jgi:hypothetical protein